MLGMCNNVDIVSPKLSLQVTSECHRALLEPLLWQLREERCAHLWQPVLAASPAAESYRVFLQMLTEGRPCTVFTYYLSRGGGEEAVAVGTISPRVVKYFPEDGIPVLGRAYVRQEYRRRSVYAMTLQHRLGQCVDQLGRRLLGVHIGTSSSRVENVFRTNFPGRVIRIGDEDLGESGVVAALLGLTAQFDRQIALPVPGHLMEEHRLLSEYLTHGVNALPLAQARQVLHALKDCQDAYRILDQFLDALQELH
jgi:hypothetical protein